MLTRTSLGASRLGSKSWWLLVIALVGFMASRVTPAARPAASTTLIVTGTGFFVTSDGYVVTCAHVVDGVRDTRVIFQSKEYSARVVAADKTHDVAVLKIDARGLLPLPQPPGNTAEIGEQAHAVGFPLLDRLGSTAKMTAVRSPASRARATLRCSYWTF